MPPAKTAVDAGVPGVRKEMNRFHQEAIMALDNIRKTGIIGAGTMGRGIAQLFALYDYPVVLVDRDEALLRAALEKVMERTEPELREKVAGHIRTATALEELADCDLVIEAVFEDMEVKKGVFAGLAQVCKKEAIIATNTSALSINALAGQVADPARFIGMHFMNPPKVMKLVEVVTGDRTSPETVRTIKELAEALRKIPAVVHDSPGFVANRLLFALVGEAMRLLESGVAGKEEIDAVLKYGLNHPMGPFELVDFIGLDICLNIMRNLHESLHDERYRPSRTLEALVGEGKLGVKTGEGFYRH
jgi:3-hydroxybutyryl-CoA dehydrogenase